MSEIFELATGPRSTRVFISAVAQETHPAFMEELMQHAAAHGGGFDVTQFMLDDAELLHISRV